MVGDAARFLDHDWARRPHRLEHPDPGGFADLLSLTAVDHVLTTTAPRTPSFRLVKDGQPLAPGSYTRSGRVGGRPYDGAADVARLSAAVSDGATVVLQSLHRSWAPLARFCRDLELALTFPVQANAYLTPAGATALAPHHDTHDVFVLQVHGHKHWRVSEPVVEAPLPRHRSTRESAAAQPLLFEADLAPGDCLYLPRGYVHAASAQEGMSLHITIGVHVVTAHDVLTAVVARAGEHPAFRAPLPVGFAAPGGDKALLEAVEACVAEAQTWLRGVDAAPVAEGLRHRFWAQRLPLLEGQLLQVAALDRLDDAAVVRRRPQSICVPGADTGDGDSLRLVLGDRQLVLPRTVEPAVRRLLDGTARPVSALADLLDAPSRLVLVRRLVREGVVEVTGAH
ncbi:MAG: cupin [Acidimicrobiia bacterium]|nr:cupin [Acidimicrobiia bacterium]